MTDEQIKHLDNAMMFSQFSSKMGAAVEITPQHMNDIRQLIEQHRTLQQQNKQLENALTELMRQVEGSTHFIVKSAPYFDAKTLLKNLQGGTDNA
jgi:signal transduction histidine kinase